jgi:hypothetical protein
MEHNIYMCMYQYYAVNMSVFDEFTTKSSKHSIRMEMLFMELNLCKKETKRLAKVYDACFSDHLYPFPPRVTYYLKLFKHFWRSDEKRENMGSLHSARLNYM